MTRCRLTHHLSFAIGIMVLRKLREASLVIVCHLLLSTEGSQEQFQQQLSCLLAL